MIKWGASQIILSNRWIFLTMWVGLAKNGPIPLIWSSPPKAVRKLVPGVSRISCSIGVFKAKCSIKIYTGISGSPPATWKRISDAATSTWCKFSVQSAGCYNLSSLESAIVTTFIITTNWRGTQCCTRSLEGRACSPKSTKWKTAMPDYTSAGLFSNLVRDMFPNSVAAVIPNTLSFSRKKNL